MHNLLSQLKQSKTNCQKKKKGALLSFEQKRADILLFENLHSRSRPLQSCFSHNKANRQRLYHLYHIAHFLDNRTLNSLGNHSVSHA